MSGFDEPGNPGHRQRSCNCASTREQPAKSREIHSRTTGSNCVGGNVPDRRLDALPAQDLVIWWNKSYYPEEDEQFDKTVAAFEKESASTSSTSTTPTRTCRARCWGGADPRPAADLAYGFLFDLAHFALGLRRRARGRLGRGRADPGAPAADRDPGRDPAQRADQRALDLRHPGGAAGRAHPRLEEHDRGGRPQPRGRSPAPGTSGTGGARPRSRRCARRPAIARSTASASRCRPRPRTRCSPT